MDNQNILEALEMMAAAFPWDTVECDVSREPKGEYQFSLWLRSNDKCGFPMECAFGVDPVAIAEQMIKAYQGKRDPSIKRKERIAKLQRELEELQGALGMPPYRPNRELAERVAELTRKEPEPIEVESSVSA